MAERHFRPKIILRPRLIGFAAALTGILVLFLPRGIRSAEPPALIIGLGLLAVLLLSFLFLLVSLPFLYRKFRTPGFSAEALPVFLPVGKNGQLEVDPPRPVFLPGVRLTARWKLHFGPLRQNVRLGLVPRGKVSVDYTASVRGVWIGHYSLEAADPFGLFVLELVDPLPRQMVSPPPRRILAGNSTQGRPSHESASAPRPKDDAEELLERREYRPGDDTRRLDWKQLARTGDMLIRIGDDTVPLQGRVWIDVTAGRGLWRGNSRSKLRRLDLSLIAADALVRRLEESGQEAMVRLPGEAEWKSASGEDWSYRLAASLPSAAGTSTGLLWTGHSPVAGPESGERLWIITHPLDYLVLPSGLPADYRVSLGLPEAEPSAIIYKRLLAYVSQKAREAGIDVRHI